MNSICVKQEKTQQADGPSRQASDGQDLVSPDRPLLNSVISDERNSFIQKQNSVVSAKSGGNNQQIIKKPNLLDSQKGVKSPNGAVAGGNQVVRQLSGKSISKNSQLLTKKQQSSTSNNQHLTDSSGIEALEKSKQSSNGEVQVRRSTRDIKPSIKLLQSAANDGGGSSARQGRVQSAASRKDSSQATTGKTAISQVASVKAFNATVDQQQVKNIPTSSDSFTSSSHQVVRKNAQKAAIIKKQASSSSATTKAGPGLPATTPQAKGSQIKTTSNKATKKLMKKVVSIENHHSEDKKQRESVAANVPPPLPLIVMRKAKEQSDAVVASKGNNADIVMTEVLSEEEEDAAENDEEGSAEPEGLQQDDGDQDEDEDDDDEDDDDEDEDEDDEEDQESSVAPSNTAKAAKVTTAGRSIKSRKKNKKQTSRKLWSKSEDDAIVELVKEYGTRKWTFVANKLEEKFKIRTRTGKQCRERWHNHLDPFINKTPINKVEEKKIFDLHKKLGNKWADIAKDLPGRSDNCIKNYFYSTHRKHQRRINKCLRNAQVAKILGLAKHTTAEELHKLVITRKTTYEEIRKIDPMKFIDLEATMRMLYDHGNMQFDDSSHTVRDISPTNASMREPKRQAVGGRGIRIVPEKVLTKRKARPPTSLTVKAPQAEKVSKRASVTSNAQQTARANSNQQAATSQQAKSKKPTVSPSSLQSQDNNDEVMQGTTSGNHHNDHDQYQNQQSTPVFVEKPQMMVIKDSSKHEVIEQEEKQKKRSKKALVKELAQKNKALSDLQAQKESQASLKAGLTLTKQDSSGKEKGFHKVPYTSHQPGSLQLQAQQSQNSYKNMGLSLLGGRSILSQHGSIVGGPAAYLPPQRGYPFPSYYNPLYGAIDPACHAKYELAWGGADFDRLGKGQPSFKSGHMPPATPDTSQLFNQPNFQGKHVRSMMMPANFNLQSMNSPMYIPVLTEASPRPPPTRTQHYTSTNPALNVTLNVNVSSADFRPPQNTIPNPQQQKPCHNCNMQKCTCNFVANLDYKDLNKLFQIDGQQSAATMLQQNVAQTGASQFNPNSSHRLNQASFHNFGRHQNFNLMQQTPSQKEEISGLASLIPSARKADGIQMCDLKSDLKRENSSGEAKQIREGLFSALNSKIKPSNLVGPNGQSFMNKLSVALPLQKDMSFGGPQSFGVISGLPSTGTAKNKQDNSVFPVTELGQKAFSTLIAGRSVTPRPLNIVTPVTFASKSIIQTPKHIPPTGLIMSNAGQDQSPPLDKLKNADAVSQKSQPSAFKPVNKRSREATQSKHGTNSGNASQQPKPVVESVTKTTNQRQAVTAELLQNVFPVSGVANTTAVLEGGHPSNNSNYLSPEEKQNIHRDINNQYNASNSPKQSLPTNNLSL